MIRRKNTIKSIVLLVIIVLALYFLGMGCMFKQVLGASCPGCGLTRAYRSLFHLDLKSAFYYHPLFWTIPIIIVLCYKKINNKVLLVFIILFLVVYIIRLFDKSNTVVTINFKDSLIYKLLSYM